MSSDQSVARELQKLYPESPVPLNLKTMLSSMVPQLRGKIGLLGGAWQLPLFRRRSRHKKLLEAGAGKDYWNFGGEKP